MANPTSLVKVYEHYKKDPIRYYFTINETQGNWTTFGSVFKALSSTTGNTVPVYMFRDKNGKESYFLSTASTTPMSNYENAGVVFYAFPTGMASTRREIVPVYQFTHYDEKAKATFYCYSTSTSIVPSEFKLDREVFATFPTEFGLGYSFDHLSYGHAEEPPNPERDILYSQTIDNPTNAVITKHFTAEKSKTNVFSITLTQTLMVGSEISFEAGVPGAAVTGSYNIQLGLESSRSWETTETLTYTVGEDITVPANTSIVAIGWVDWVDDYVIPTVLRLKVSAHVGTAPVEDLSGLLSELGFTGRVVEEVPEHVVVELDGNFMGTMGIDMGTSTEDASVPINPPK